MNRVRFIEHRGTRIVLLGFAGITDVEQGLADVAEATTFFGAQPVGGRTMTRTGVTDTRYDRKIVDALKVMTAKNRPIVRTTGASTLADPPPGLCRRVRCARTILW